MRLVWEDDILLILKVPKDRGFGELWNRLKLVVSATTRPKSEEPQIEEAPWDDKFIPVRGEVSDDVVNIMKGWVLGNLPMPPVVHPRYCTTCPHTQDMREATVELQMQFEKVKLGATEPDRIVGWVCAEPYCRVLVGRLEKSVFHLSWVSPLTGHAVGSAGPWLLYEDVNADGIAEIWVYSHLPAGSQWGQRLSIFDLNGRELTRDAGECGELEDLPPGKKPVFDSVCPIWGVPFVEHSFEENDSHRIYLEASREIRGSEERSVIYRLRDGNYVQGKREDVEPPPEPTRTPAEWNEEGMQCMKRKDYHGAIDKFIMAQYLSRIKPGTTPNVLYVNNLGYAYFKLEMYDAAVLCFRQAIQIDPKRAVAYLNLGEALAKLSRNAEAREAYQKYLELAPDSKSAAEVKKKLEALPPAP